MKLLINHLTATFSQSSEGTIYNYQIYAIGILLIALIAAIITTHRKTSNI